MFYSMVIKIQISVKLCPILFKYKNNSALQFLNRDFFCVPSIIFIFYIDIFLHVNFNERKSDFFLRFPWKYPLYYLFIFLPWWFVNKQSSSAGSHSLLKLTLKVKLSASPFEKNVPTNAFSSASNIVRVLLQVFSNVDPTINVDFYMVHPSSGSRRRAHQVPL